MSNLNLPPATLQRLIDFAHAAMEKRHGYPSDYVVTQSRRPEGHAVLTVEDLQAVQQLGKPSWDHALTSPASEHLENWGAEGRNEMLVLSRKKNEAIVFNDDITITVVEIRGDKVRLGIEAPKEVPVHRREVYDAIKRENDEQEN